MKKQVKNGVIKVLILVLILAGAYGLWCHFLTDNVIWKKLKINGIAIQGMTKEEAIDAISKDFQEKYENTQMTITLNGKNFKVSIYPVLGLDVKSIVESAYALGHGAWFTHGTDRIELMNSKTKEEVTLMPEARNKDELTSFWRMLEFQRDPPLYRLPVNLQIQSWLSLREKPESVRIWMH